MENFQRPNRGSIAVKVKESQWANWILIPHTDTDTNSKWNRFWPLQLVMPCGCHEKVKVEKEKNQQRTYELLSNCIFFTIYFIHQQKAPSLHISWICTCYCIPTADLHTKIHCNAQGYECGVVHACAHRFSLCVGRS